jgi:hypothetical protein
MKEYEKIQEFNLRAEPVRPVPLKPISQLLKEKEN